MSDVRDALRARGELLPGEEALFEQADVAALPPREQLEHLRANRGVGLFVVALAGGVRLLVLAGGLVAIVGLSIGGEIEGRAMWATVPIALALAAFLAWSVPRFVRRVRDQRRALPRYDELFPDDPRG